MVFLHLLHMRKTPLFTAREPLWRSKWPLGHALLLLERSEELVGPGSASPVRSKWLLGPAPVPPVATRALKKLDRARLSALSALKDAVRDHSKALVSVTLCSEPRYSALLCSVHGLSLIHI